MNQLKLLLLAGLFGALGATEALSQPAADTPPQVTAPVGTLSANINITPKRLTFDLNRRTGTVYLFNQGDAPATIDLTLVDRIMRTDGSILNVEEAQKSAENKPVLDQLKSARDMVQLSPRRVVLAPGKGQTIRLRIGNIPESGQAAEYRTHLTVTNVPPKDTGVTAEQAAAADAGGNKLSFKVTTVYGLSIPVIIRTGAVDVRADLENPHIVTEQIAPDTRTPPRPTPVLVVDLVRKGPNSVYGVVELVPAGVKKPEPLAVARGVAVYPEVERRSVRIPLSRAPKPGEKLEVTFTDDDTSPGKVLAKTGL